MKAEQSYYSSDMDGGDPGCVVRVRGLPWSASQEEVADFLEGVNIVGGKNGVHFTYVRDGRPSGEAYIQLASEEDVQKACAHDKHHMGKRYIEVFRSKSSEMDWVVKRSGPDQHQPNSDAVIRLRGLPFGCSKEEVAHFFSGMEIVPNGITLLQDQQGRTTGDAYVQFASQDIAEMAQTKHKERIGHRYIEIFKSSLAEVKYALAPRVRGLMNSPMGRPGPYDRGDRFGNMGGGNMGGGGGGGGGGMNQGMSYGRGRGRSNVKGYYDDCFDDSNYGNMGGNFGSKGGHMSGSRRGGMGGGGSGSRSYGGGGGGRFGGGSSRGGGGSSYMDEHDSQTGHTVHMRGLPFAANEQDILEFFKPLNPVNVVIHFNNEGRASGEADVDFNSHEEASEAMKRDRGNMQHRYVELFLKSTQGGRHGHSYSGGGGGGNSSFNSGGGGGAAGMGFGNSPSSFGSNMNNNGFGNGGGNSYSHSGGGGYGSPTGGGNMGGGFGNMGSNPNYTAF